MIVAIHQPNFLPWLGYFAKMARAEFFVLLDDVQYSKGGFTNRVQVGGNTPIWLTLPVSHRFSDPISAVRIAQPKWAQLHRDKLFHLYCEAVFFAEIFPEVESWLFAAQSENLAETNIFLVEKIAVKLGLKGKRVVSSSLGVPASEADIRLAEICRLLAPGGTYLSGAGGAKYQSQDAYAQRGITLRYTQFQPPLYHRGCHPEIAGLSILDAAFHAGWDAVFEMIS